MAALYLKVYHIYLTVVTQEILNRYLRNLNIEDRTPIGTTDKVLKEIIKQGYIEKVKDMSSGETRYDYHLAPRGKVEVGEQGTMNFIKQVQITQIKKH
jgi:melanoma-associated antigen